MIVKTLLYSGSVKNIKSLKIIISALLCLDISNSIRDNKYRDKFEFYN